MSLAQAEERRPSPLLSNNPFRNRIGSSTPSPPPAKQTAGRASTNPFLDTNEATESPTKPIATVERSSTGPPPKKTMTENTRELFDNLEIDDRPQSPRQFPSAQPNGVHRRPENMPPRPPGRMAPPGHRPSASEEDRRRQRALRGLPGEADIFADPPDSSRLRERRPRRNSESSVRDKTPKMSESEEDKKRRERRARDRRPGKPSSRRLDIIDKLDVTSIYGTGLFHHDGPFDACNPHRNRRGQKHAPMQAFPKDSRNMSIGGSGPNHSRLNLDLFHGVGQEAHVDYNEAAVVDEDAEYMRRAMPPRTTSFDPTERTEPVHGEESAGLGTSTFLEGAPASRAAIQRRESELENELNGLSLSRKKSLAQRIRAVRTGERRGTTTSPEPNETATSPLGTAQSESNANPFFKDYDKEYDRKGAAIALAEEQQRATGRARAPSSPMRGLGLERKTTQESYGIGEDGKPGVGGGLLNRVKSLKGRSKARGERRDAS